MLSRHFSLIQVSVSAPGDRKETPNPLMQISEAFPDLRDISIHTQPHSTIYFVDYLSLLSIVFKTSRLEK